MSRLPVVTFAQAVLEEQWREHFGLGSFTDGSVFGMDAFEVYQEVVSNWVSDALRRSIRAALSWTSWVISLAEVADC